MGQQQMLMVILGILIVGIAITVGIVQFGAHSQGANKDGVTATLVALGADAYQYKLRPITLGGGSNSYENYTVPVKLKSDEYGFSYQQGTVTKTSCEIRGTSTVNTAWAATCMVDDTGKTTITYSGW